MEARDFLSTLAGVARAGNGSADRPARLAVVDPAFSPSSYPATLPRVTFEGETVMSTRRYAVAGNYVPRPSDRVLMAPVGTTYAILGAIPGSAASVSGMWQPYTPAWTAVTTDPVLGDGTIAGRYTRIGNTVVCAGRIFMGAGTTYGSGAWRISVPIATSQGLIGAGSAWLFDSTGGSTSRFPSSAYFASTTTLGFMYPAGGEVAGTVPFAWASGDQLRWTFTYEVS